METPKATREMETPKDIQVKEINKRSSGHAFEVILSPSSLERSKADIQRSTTPKKDISMEEIQRKLGAADERRRSNEAEILKHLAREREHEKEVHQKAIEGSKVFSKVTEEKLNQKMEANKENRKAQTELLNMKFKEKDKKIEEVRNFRMNKDATED